MSRGFALAGTILLTTAVAAVALTAAVRTQVQYQRAKINLQRIQTIYAARSGLAIARHLLLTQQTWASLPVDVPLIKNNKTTVILSISDENAKVNLNHLLYPSQELSKAHSLLLQTHLKIHTGASSPSLTHAIVSLIREHRRSHQTALDSVFYLKPVFSQYRIPLETELWQDFTIHGNGRININSLDEKMMQTVLDDPMGRQAKKIVAQRRDRPFESPFDFKYRSGISDQKFTALLTVLTVHSAYFTVRSTARTHATAAHAEFVVHRSGKLFRILRYREWWS